MTRRNIALISALVLLMLAALAGLPRMAGHLMARRMDQPAYVTVTPEPAYDGE